MDSEFDKEFILGPAGARFAKTHAIKTSNDGATIAMFGPGLTAQVRRRFGKVSPNTEISDDRSAAQSCQGDRPSRERHCPGEARRHGNDQIATVELQNLTPHAFFERVSGDWDVVRNVTDLPQDAADKLRQAFCLGRVAKVDEVYATFMDFGLIQERKKGNTHATGVNPSQVSSTGSYSLAKAHEA